MANIIEITDFNVPELDVYARLTEAQLLTKVRPVSFLIEALEDDGCEPDITDSSSPQDLSE